ncbi:NADPH-dependent FMN reductase [Lysobacter sp. TAB13]|uniref:NADPH-dependent FMN reductase n=1 Tax=Lysobacter sp. TAB13 TaxID=3233065 RepID=UPI003F94F810
MKLLGLCGSLRARSYSAGLLRAAAASAPDGASLALFEREGQLPLFNPDLETQAPDVVVALWDAVTAADAIVIVSPEYAHGPTGTIKNALDWLVGHPPFAYKPVALFNPAFQSYHADEALKETLRTMSADLIDDACVRIPVIGSGVASDQIAGAPAFASALDAAWREILAHVRAAQRLQRALGESAR